VEVLNVRARGRPKETWNDVIGKRLSDPTNVQGRWYGPCGMEKVKDVV